MSLIREDETIEESLLRRLQVQEIQLEKVMEQTKNMKEIVIDLIVHYAETDRP